MSRPDPNHSLLVNQYSTRIRFVQSKYFRIQFALNSADPVIARSEAIEEIRNGIASARLSSNANANDYISTLGTIIIENLQRNDLYQNRKLHNQQIRLSGTKPYKNMPSMYEIKTCY